MTTSREERVAYALKVVLWKCMLLYCVKFVLLVYFFIFVHNPEIFSLQLMEGYPSDGFNEGITFVIKRNTVKHAQFFWKVCVQSNVLKQHFPCNYSI